MLKRITKTAVVTIIVCLIALEGLGYVISGIQKFVPNADIVIKYNDNVEDDAKDTIKRAIDSLPDSLKTAYAADRGKVHVKTLSANSATYTEGFYLGFLPKTVEAVFGRQIYLFPVLKEPGILFDGIDEDTVVHEFMHFMWDLKSYKSYQGYDEALAEKSLIMQDYYTKLDGFYANGYLEEDNEEYFAEVARLYWQGKLNQKDYPATYEFMSNVGYLN